MLLAKNYQHLQICPFSYSKWLVRSTMYRCWSIYRPALGKYSKHLGISHRPRVIEINYSEITHSTFPITFPDTTKLLVSKTSSGKK